MDRGGRVGNPKLQLNILLMLLDIVPDDPEGCLVIYSTQGLNNLPTGTKHLQQTCSRLMSVPTQMEGEKGKWWPSSRQSFREPLFTFGAKKGARAD